MKSLTVLLLLLLCASLTSFAEDKIKMNFKDQDITKIIEMYSKETGQKFVVDAAVRGKVSIFIQEAISKEEAFNQLSSALALNSYGISKQGDTMVVRSARNIQRDLVEVSTEKPSLKPERMYTWVYNAKNVDVTTINRDLRILTSKDGEMSIVEGTNQLIITDWVANITRVAEIMQNIDRPLDPATAKFVEGARRARAANDRPEKKSEK